MQIIQTIREKGAPITIAAIALALIAFILMDAKQDKGVSASESIGKVNGSSIDQNEFNKKLQNVESQEEQQTGQKPSNSRLAQIRDQVWNQIVAEKVFYAEAAKLGIEFTSKELDKVLKSDDPSNPLMQDRSMIDPATGKMDQAKLTQALTNIKKAKGEQWEMINAQIIEPQKLASVSTKYFALLNASAYYPAWMEEKDAKENKTFATISFVQIPYQTISDSTIKVTDDEIKKYVESHKGLFKQEAGRMISYVGFSQLPSAADSAKTKAQVESLKAEFANETNVKNFLARNASAIDFDTNYVPKSKIQSAYTDSIIKMPAGTVYGPYVENKSFVVAKMLGSKTVPDSAHAKHILIATVNAQTGQPVLEDSTAKKRADSVYNAINAGANFAMLAMQYSSDGSKDKGGDLGTFAYGAMVPEFNKYCFEKPVGSRGVVRTQFGYHIIELLSQKGASPAYKIGFLAKEIYPSEETINNASNNAVALSAEKDAKKMQAYLDKNGLQKISVPTIIKENDASIGQMQDARQLVRWVFEAKKGDVSDPMPVGDQFVVATVDKIYEEGTQDVETARPLAENAIREEKKAEQIISALGANPTLESASAKYSKAIIMTGADSSITFKAQIIDSIGNEPKLIGAIFNKANLNKVAAPVAGKAGVFVFKVNSFGEKAADPNEDKVQMRLQQTVALRNQAVSNWFEGLRKKATIKDNRSKFF
ncbi:MAG: peptidylprolyl isomerase [Chitinophagaceae bacterium]|nr:peptidylprolyl isomerase [Chitinophagaceae bacterium]MBK9486835.1 peptidylprolyl isomerase [Chitinophagaceae bacterium]